MRRMIILLCFLMTACLQNISSMSGSDQRTMPAPAALPFRTATAIATATLTRMYVCHTDVGLNVRSVMAAAGPILRTLPPKLEVTLLEVNGQWGKIGAGEYVAMKYLCFR